MVTKVRLEAKVSVLAACKATYSVGPYVPDGCTEYSPPCVAVYS